MTNGTIPSYVSLTRDRDPQEGRRNRRCVRGFAPVLALEEGLEILLEIRGLATLFRGGECVHRGAVVHSEISQVGGRCDRSVEGIRVLDERDLLAWNTRCRKSLDHIPLNAP